DERLCPPMHYIKYFCSKKIVLELAFGGGHRTRQVSGSLLRWCPSGYGAGGSARGKARGPRLRPWPLLQPGNNPIDIDCCGGRDMLQVGFFEPPVPGVSQPDTPHHVPGGQRTRCCAHSTSHWSTVYPPSTCACHPGVGRVGPRKVIPCWSWLSTSRSALIYAASTRCSPGGRACSTRACWIGT